MQFSSYPAFENSLDGLGLFSMHLGLARMRDALDRMDLGSPLAVVIHVVGTNGKGSTAGFLEALARAHGLTTGLYTSPHLVSVRERVRINNMLLSEACWLAAANAVMEQCADIGLTYFELLTVMALHVFQTEQVDCIVLEAGLGGTHDATCAVRTDFAVMTPVGLDHEVVLGSTLLDIAKDKSGALGRCPAVSATQDASVQDVYRRAAQAGGHDIIFLESSDCRDGEHGAGHSHGMAWRALDLPLHPSFQRQNAHLALLAWGILARLRDWPFDSGLCSLALAQATFPGRFHRHGAFLVDGAHNPMGLEALCESVQAKSLHFDTLIFQSMRDKTLCPELLERLGTLAERIVIPDLPGLERAWNAAALARLMGPSAESVADIRAAVRLAEGTATLICGSLYLAGAYYELFPDFLSHWETRSRS